MWRLVARDRDGREVGRTIVGESGEVVIGRDPEAGIVLPSVGVSRRHARIRAQGGELTIHDEGSANGVIVEGHRILRPTPLAAGQVVQIAEFLIDVDLDKGASGPPRVGERWRLVVHGGTLDGRAFELPRTGDGVLGRGPGADVAVEHESISRRHARIASTDGALQVEDLGSQNGTYVGGVRVERARVQAGQSVQLGDVLFVVERGAGSSTAYVGAAAWRRLAVWAGVAAAVLVLILVLALHRSAPPKPTGLERLQAEIDEHVERARLAMSRRAWDEAARELEAARDRDPLDGQVTQLSSRVARERTFAARVEEAQHQLDRGGPEDLIRARTLLVQVPEDSAYHRDAEIRLRDIAVKLPDLLLREAARECVHPDSTRCKTLVCAPEAAPIRHRYPHVTCP